jgi:transcriptional regulator with XRE-family HTH domain
MEPERQKEGIQQQCQYRSIPLPALRAVRRRMALSQRQLARMAGISASIVRLLENERRGAYPSSVQKLALALGVAPAELMQEHRRE